MIYPSRKQLLLPALFVLFSTGFLFDSNISLLIYGATIFPIYVLILFNLLVKKQRLLSGGPLTKEIILIIFYVLICAYNGVSHGTVSYQNVILLIMTTSYFIFSSYLNWNERPLRFIYFLIIMYIVINMVAIAFTEQSSIYPDGIFHNSNLLGGYTGFLTFFPLLKMITSNSNKVKFFCFITLIALLSLVYVSDTRSVFLALLVAFFVYIMFNLIAKNEFFYNLFFLLILGLSLSFIVIYPNLVKYVWFNKLDMFIFSLTGKHIYTGREILWADLVKIINDKPIFGHDPAATASTYMNVELSSHNLFIETALQTGWFGVGIISLILFFVWKRLRVGRHDKRVRLTGGFLIAIVIHQSFEVSLTQNNIVIGMLQWLILAIGTSYALSFKKNQEVVFRFDNPQKRKRKYKIVW